jgi:Polyketide cyclase / dehydrase and lipid transport
MTTLTGTLTVALPPAEAFHLFTPRGEVCWAAGWDPRFRQGTTDDSEPGTVFETQAHGQTATWLVMDRTPDKRIRYARVIPSQNAGTVTVVLAATGEHTTVTVTYDLVPLSEPGDRQLQVFAAGYPDFLKSWQTAIAAIC